MTAAPTLDRYPFGIDSAYLAAAKPAGLFRAVMKLGTHAHWTDMTINGRDDTVPHQITHRVRTEG